MQSFDGKIQRIRKVSECGTEADAHSLCVFQMVFLSCLIDAVSGFDLYYALVGSSIYPVVE